MPAKQLPDELTAEMHEIAAHQGCELLEVQFQGGVLRLILDREEGITLEHCTTVSRAVSAILDTEDFGRGRYTLEVSSPGLDRKLYGPADYEKFRGQRVMAKFLTSPERKKKSIIGTLASHDTESVFVVEGEVQHAIPLADLQVIRLDPEV